MGPQKPLYKPISASEFRVVHILPGTFNDELRCVLETRSSIIKTRYEALSYQWGDDSITKPIRIAHLAPAFRQSQTPAQDLKVKPQPWSFLSRFEPLFDKLRVAAAKYKYFLKFLSWSLGTALIWHYTSPLPLEPAGWIAWFGVPAKPFIFFVCMVCGAAPMDFAVRASKLLMEILRTKPWNLALHAVRFKKGSKELNGLEWQGKGVTVNLERALKYLRLKDKPRTVWVDALCINQEDEGEKQMQIQRMDAVYANASTVVVWLGGYHSSHHTSMDGCQEGDDCVHHRQIETAFDVFWRLSGWRLIVPSFVIRNKAELIRSAIPGLQDLYSRGWWERLWVIQEVALATGPVLLQCGRHYCEFQNFQSAQHAILDELHSVKDIKDSAPPVERLRMVVKDFRHSEFHDREAEPLGKMVATGLLKVVSLAFRTETEEKKVRFHDQSFAARLQRILLRTAGHFQCRDDRDRLYAVMGIAGGARLGKVTQLSDLVRCVSSFSTGQVIGHAMDPLFKAYPESWRLKLAGYAIGFLCGGWAWYYESRAKFWTITRPEYVVTGYAEVIDAVTGGSGLNSTGNRVEFFTALARHLARETKTLAFLDAACCGEDKDQRMPSWVPNWTREVGNDAYNFAIRKKDGLAADLFAFDKDGKTLWVMGQPKGRVDVVRAVEDESGVLPVQRIMESWLALTHEGKEAMKAIFQLMGYVMTEDLESEEAEGRGRILEISLELIEVLMEAGSMLLKMGDSTTVVYSLGNLAGEMGFLKAGEAARGDRIVFVPGCFHHLVLRKHGRTTSGGVQWRLVGLVAMGTNKRKRGGCAEKKWAKLRENGEVFRYAIV
ncbi:hypothetical protein VTI74DRAFT_11665 [Chaetomium olivicolor]